MNDIKNRADLEIIMATFYSKLLQDNAISYFFTDVAQIDLKAHLPVITDFWEQTMFQSGGYKKNVLQIHLDLNRQSQINEEHFDIWLNHFFTTVDALFTGENAEKIKTRAVSISTIMKLKISEK